MGIGLWTHKLLLFILEQYYIFPPNRSSLRILFSTQDALDAMKALGLNPGEQEMIDMTNEVGTWQLVAVSQR